MARTEFDGGPVEAAGGGLLQRRVFLQHGAFLAALAGESEFAMAAAASAESSALSVPDWSKIPGSPFVGYGQPSKFEAGVVRIAGSAANPANAPASERFGRRCIGCTAPSRPMGCISSEATAAFPTSIPTHIGC